MANTPTTLVRAGQTPVTSSAIPTQRRVGAPTRSATARRLSDVTDTLPGKPRNATMSRLTAGGREPATLARGRLGGVRPSAGRTGPGERRTKQARGPGD